MREKFNNFLISLMIPFTMCWPLFFLVPMFYNSINTTTEIFTATCEVTEKYTDEDAYVNAGMSSLLGMTIYEHDTDYIVVVDYEGNSYEVQVDEDVYDEIAIGEQVVCELKHKYNEKSQEESYEVDLIQEEL